MKLTFKKQTMFSITQCIMFFKKANLLHRYLHSHMHAHRQTHTYTLKQIQMKLYGHPYITVQYSLKN